MYLHVFEQLYVKYMFQGTKGTIQKTSAIHYLTTNFTQVNDYATLYTKEFKIKIDC